MLQAGFEIDLESAVAPLQQAVNRLLPVQPIELGVDHLAVAKKQAGPPGRQGGGDKQADARFAPDLDRLDQVDDTHVAQVAGEAGFLIAPFQRLALLLLEQDFDPSDDLLDVDRLGQVVVDAQFQAPDLVFDRFLVGQKDEGHVAQLGLGPQLLAELEAVHDRHLCVRDNQGRRRDSHFFQGIHAVDGGGDRKPSLAQADLHDPQGFGITVDQQ